MCEEKDTRPVNTAITADAKTNGYENQNYDNYCSNAMPMTANRITDGTNGVEGSAYNIGKIVISNASARWTDNDKSLDDINLTITPGRLYAIIGPVGAGKVLLFFFKNILIKKKNHTRCDD